MKSLSVDFNKKLKNFDLQMQFTMQEGSLGILGASGCGKSMTLKAIAGIVTPEEGCICTESTTFFDSSQKLNLPPQKRKVGYLFQNYALFPNMTVAENIAVGVKGGSGRREKRQSIQMQVQKLMEQFHLKDLKDQYPSKLSGGQQQRTALARILASKPDILLLDEPFSAMDSYLREELQLELNNRLKGFRGCSIIVSHDRDEIYKLCSHTMIMDSGINLVCEETQSLFSRPGRMLAARLTGCKNISKAVRISKHTVHALDWGVEFRIDRDMPEKLSYLGIRAHDFIPIDSDDKRKENIIEVLPCDTVKSPFEWTLLFKNKEKPLSEMWMKQDRETVQIPKRVWVDQEKILLLED